jgi:hypothetical protein
MKGQGQVLSVDQAGQDRFDGETGEFRGIGLVLEI